jgi:hypothetical protein
MPRSRKATIADSAQVLKDYVAHNAADVVTTLNSIGLWHISPCTDVGFKHVLADDNRAIHFISSFSRLLDVSPDPSCRMLDRKKILEERSVGFIERIPESIGYTGEVIGNKVKKKKNEKDEGSVLPEHPKIDSGFLVGLSDGEVYKMGIEMQVIDKGNMPARGVDYGSRIFRHKGESGNEGSVRKVFELLLNRWNITNATNKLASSIEIRGAECDKDVRGDLVDSVCLCCISIFLGKSIDIIQQIINYLGNEVRAGSRNINDNDRQEIRNLVEQAMKKERRVLSKQVMTFMQPGRDVSRRGYRNLNADEKKLVDRLGFFKYGHLMSDNDVQALEDGDLKKDYQCIKIQKENVMENIDQISAIWGAINPYNDTTMTIAKLDAKVRAKDKEIARLKEQLAQAQQKSPNKGIAERSVESAKQKQSGLRKNKNQSPAKPQMPPKMFQGNRPKQWHKK